MPVSQKRQQGNPIGEVFPSLNLLQLPEKRSAAETTPFLQAFEDTGLQDVFSSRAAHCTLAQHIMGSKQPVLWVQDHASRMEFGLPSLTAAAARGDILYTPARNAHDALWAMEEAIKTGVNVIGEIMGSPRILDFTATRRLELFSRAAGVRCMLVRTGVQTQTGGSSSARWRWRVDAHRSQLHPFDAAAPGKPRWSIELLRARTLQPGRWIVETCEPDDERGTPHHLRVVSQLATGNVDAGAAQPATTGNSTNVIPLRSS